MSVEGIKVESDILWVKYTVRNTLVKIASRNLSSICLIWENIPSLKGAGCLFYRNVLPYFFCGIAFKIIIAITSAVNRLGCW